MTIDVVAAILKKKKSFLISSRPESKSFHGFWEFPGGKVKQNEFMLEALKRELKEELDLTINSNKTIFLYNYSIYRKEKKINLNFFLCFDWFGKLNPLEKQEYEWIKISELKNFKILRSNKKILQKIRYFF